MMQIGLSRFSDHMVFENGAAQRMVHDLSGLPDAQQVAQQPGIVEVELGTLDHPLVEITVVRRQQKNDET